MWREHADVGYESKACLIPPGWCLSTRLRSARTWCGSGGGLHSGVRVIGTVPLGAWETITFVAALRHNKMTAPMVIEGAMTGEMFLAYVEQCLVPTLRRNDIVVMDNCRIHLVPAFGRRLRKRGRHFAICRSTRLTSIRSRCLTANSRHFLRKVAARTVPGLNRAIRSFIPQLSPQECANYFSHAGGRRDQSFVDARDRSFQSAPCFCQFIRMWRLVELFLPSATASLSPTQWNRTIAAGPTTRILGS